MTTPNSTTEAGVTDALPALPPIPVGDRFADQTKFRLLGEGGGEVLYECWGDAIRDYAVAYAKLCLAQSRASAQGGEKVELPQHFATICDDGYWIVNKLGPHGYNNINAGWPSKKVYTEEQVRAILATPPATSGMTELEEMRERKDAAYLERNQVVAALAKCFPSGMGRTAIEGWSEDWHGCVYIDLPTGQASWHFHDSQAYLFAGLPNYHGSWDGHDTPEKYRRLAALPLPEQCTSSSPQACWRVRCNLGNTCAATPPNAPQDSLVGDAERDVLAERRRQIEAEGWTEEHDNHHTGGEMAMAAACYALHSAGFYQATSAAEPPKHWPWSYADWKPKDARRDLVRAGALVLAEIEHMDRAAIRADRKG